MASKQSHVRLTDVAEHAGVSMKTVSNVVHGYPHVSDALRARVQQAIIDLGYRPNLTARRLATGKTGMLALALPELSHPYFSELAGHMSELAAELGYRLVIEQTLHDPDAERAVLADREHGLVDGVIFHPIYIDSDEIMALDRSFPLVLIGETARPETTDHVMIDNVAAAADAVGHLLSTGRRRVAFLGMVDGEPGDSNEMRLQGYLRAHSEHGIDADPDLVLRCATYSVETAAAALAPVLADRAVDAVLCREDRFAIAALQAAAVAGLRVPDDLAVVGWDDTPVASWTIPLLTGVRPDKRELARTALRLVHERINGFDGAGRHVLAPHSLVVRDSA